MENFNRLKPVDAIENLIKWLQNIYNITYQEIKNS